MRIAAEKNVMSDSGELLDVADLDSDFSDSGDELEVDADLTVQQRTVFGQFRILYSHISLLYNCQTTVVNNIENKKNILSVN